MRLEQFRAFGYLTDVGGLQPAEYQARAVAEDAAEAAACAAALRPRSLRPAGCRGQPAGGQEIESLSSNLGARRFEGEEGPSLVDGQGKRVPFDTRLWAAILEMDAE